MRQETIGIMLRICVISWTLLNLENFYYFETGVFQHLRQLQTIYIHRAPKLLKIQPEVFTAHLPHLKILRIVNTGLEEMPNLNGLNTSSVLHMIDLENNRIQRITTRQVSRVKAEQLLLNFNDLQVVEEAAFDGSEIANLSLKGNFRLTNLHVRAFHGLQSLRHMNWRPLLLETARCPWEQRKKLALLQGPPGVQHLLDRTCPTQIALVKIPVPPIPVFGENWSYVPTRELRTNSSGMDLLRTVEFG
ncbi:hypothetical protein GEV33_006052 [Tenebrio molitor]|uniref:Uncharacterized protein n=1 Tax=Tenebrio molitor TaxID=7067 RepID=A0A8J6HLA6_TENMO|nr:hypothetical protein GEV33_006052 [Tenebrio molitor]